MSKPIVVQDPAGSIIAGGFGRVVNGEYTDKLPKLYGYLTKLANDPAIPQVHFKGETVYKPEVKPEPKPETPDKEKAGGEK